MLGSREWYEVLAQFEKQHKGMRLDKEAPEYFRLRAFYQDGQVNQRFLDFLDGYAYAKTIFQEVP